MFLLSKGWIMFCCFHRPKKFAAAIQVTDCVIMCLHVSDLFFTSGFLFILSCPTSCVCLNEAWSFRAASEVSKTHTFR